MVYQPIIVLGPPRNGTSTVARILSEHFGVRMTQKKLGATKFNLDGLYEDFEIANNCNHFYGGHISFNEWWESFMSFVDNMVILEKPWGFKEPRLGALVIPIVRYFDKAILIRCIRNRQKSINSMVSNLGLGRKEAQNMYDVGHNAIDLALKNKPHLRISYGDNSYSDEQIIKAISQIEQRIVYAA